MGGPALLPSDGLQHLHTRLFSDHLQAGYKKHAAKVAVLTYGKPEEHTQHSELVFSSLLVSGNIAS